MSEPTVSGVMPLDTSRFPDSCAFEGAVKPVSYDVGRIQAESNREWPGLWWAVPAAMVLAVAASMLWPLGFAS